MIGWILAVAVAVLTGHAMVNGRLLRRPPARPSPVDGGVSVLLPGEGLTAQMDITLLES